MDTTSRVADLWGMSTKPGQAHNALAQQNVLPCLDAVGSMHKLTAIENETVLVKHFQALLHAVNTMQLEQYVKRDFSDVFEKYIKA
jgi:hypothetical protein